MERVKVSVIIPVYNTDKYIASAIESIINQSLREIEIIVINDGSTDESLSIIERYAKDDKRIKVYTQTNKGLSRTRNKGIDEATGDYIYFMDSDDLIDQDTLEMCYAKCIKDQLDFVFFDAENIYEDDFKDKPWQNYLRTNDLEQKVYSGIEIFNIQVSNYLFRSSVCLNIIKTDFIKKNDLYFYPNIIHEDQLFSCLLYLHASKVSFINRTFFKRRIRKNSIMTVQFNWKNIEGYFCVTDELIRFSTFKDPEIKSAINMFLKQMLNAVIWNAKALSLSNRLKLFTISIRKYKRYIHFSSLIKLLFRPFIFSNAKNKIIR